MSYFDDDVESECKRQIIALQQEYHARAKPWVDRLATIYALRPSPPMIIDTSNIDPEILAKIGRIGE